LAKVLGQIEVHGLVPVAATLTQARARRILEEARMVRLEPEDGDLAGRLSAADSVPDTKFYPAGSTVDRSPASRR
jgi:hypothetical protein